MAEMAIHLEIGLGGRLTYIPGVTWILSRLIASKIYTEIQTRLTDEFKSRNLVINTEMRIDEVSIGQNKTISIDYRLKFNTQNVERLAGFMQLTGRIATGMDKSADVILKTFIKSQLVTNIPPQIKSALSSAWLNAPQVEVKVD